MSKRILGTAPAVAFAAAVGLATSGAGAATITINSTSPDWGPISGGTGVVERTTGSGNASVFEVRWGIPASGNPNNADNKSGLGFNPDNPPIANVQTDTVFRLGTLTHFNNPVAGGTAADSAVLTLATNILNATPANQSFAYRFDIDETPNNPPCAYPGGPACADRISFANLDTTNAFTVGGQAYTIALLGFSTDGGTTITSSFISNEGGTNTAGLYARITAPFVSVPEPTTLAILGAGLLGLGIARRRRAAA